MSDSARRYLIAYDVGDDKRRDKLAECLQSYGVRIQYSVFTVEAKPAKMDRMVQKLKSIIAAKEDSVIVCDLGPCEAADKRRILYLGQRAQTCGDGPMVI